MTHVALPEHGSERWPLTLVGVLGDWAHGEHASNANNDAPGIFRERGALRVEKAE